MKQRRKKAARPSCGEQVLATAELTALAFTVAVKGMLREQYGWEEDAAEAFGDALWTRASGMMSAAIAGSQERRQAAGEKVGA